MYKSIFVLIVIVFFSFPSIAEDIYIAQTAQGGDTGVDSSNAHSVAWFNSSQNWKNQTGKISEGDTVHLYGTISTALTIYGHNRTIFFEDDAKLSAPYWPATGAIAGLDVNHILIDGGTNGLIECTDNGTALGNQVFTVGIKLTHSSNSELRNLTISNIYQRTPYSNESNENSGGSGIRLLGNSSNVSVHGCSIVNASQGISVSLGSGETTSNLRIYNNIISGCSDGITCGSGGVNAIGIDIEIYNNTISGNYVWDGSWTPPPGDGHHHNDGIQCWSWHTGASTTNLKIYNNTIGPNMGNSISGWLFVEGYFPGLLIYNNLLKANVGSSPTNGFIFLKNGDNAKVYNNTVVSGGAGIGIGLNADTTDADLQNNIIVNVAVGIRVDADCSVAVSDYNVFYGLGEILMYYQSGFSTFLDWQSLKGFDAHSITDDPLLDSNSKLTSPSPAIDAGIDFSAYFTTDKDGTARPQGLPWDLGAYEQQQALSPPQNVRIE
ncbi:MAG: hypothetical protein GY797_28915 [Deltaproteobacteria bacterium]|nr:hypothetical protein [Deltaproteobacteria bacterium]